MANTLRMLSRYVAWLGVVLAAAAVVLVMSYRSAVGPVVIATIACFALSCMGHPFFKSFSFTVWVFAFVATSMFYPVAFGTWLGYDLGKLIVPLIQIIMFGMGTTLSLADFTRVFKMPWPVFVGFVLQYSVMPLVGFGLAWTLGFEPHVAAGLVLIGSCPGGVASNVMTYLAGGDVALSVTMTSCSTLASPVMTPFWMKVLAGEFIPISFLEMMFSIINMIIVPLAAGFVTNRILYGRRDSLHRAGPLAAISVTATAAALCMGFFGPSLGPLGKGGIVVGLVLIGAVALAKLVISVWLKGPENWMDRTLPIVSMAGICFIIAIITARSRNDLLTVGPLLIVAAVAHNLIGYLLGYWLARAARLSEAACRTVAIEVGMQNGGMGSALAMDVNVLGSAKAALAPAVFGPWMNVSGSILATWWRQKPVKETKPIADLALQMEQDV